MRPFAATYAGTHRHHGPDGLPPWSERRRLGPSGRASPRGPGHRPRWRSPSRPRATAPAPPARRPARPMRPDVGHLRIRASIAREWPFVQPSAVPACPPRVRRAGGVWRGHDRCRPPRPVQLTGAPNDVFRIIDVTFIRCGPGHGGFSHSHAPRPSGCQPPRLRD